MDRTEMDPQAAWLLLMDAMATGHWRVVREQAQDIRAWIELGGLPPNVSNNKVTDRSWNRQLALYACKLARFIARRKLRGNSTRPTNQRG